MDQERIEQTPFSDIKGSVMQLSRMRADNLNVDFFVLVAWLEQLSLVTARMYFECERLRKEMDAIQNGGG